MEGDPFSDLNEKQKQDTLQLMEIANIQKSEEAKHFMEMANFDMNNAMALYFEHGSSGQQNQQSQNQGQQQMFNNESQQQQQMFNDDQHLYGGHEQQFLQQLHHQFQQQAQQQNRHQLDGINPDILRKYKIFREKKEMEDGSVLGKAVGFIGKGTKSLFTNLVPIGIRGERQGGEEFVQFIKKKIELENTYDFQRCQFREIQEKAHYQSRPVLVFLYQDSCPTKELQLKLLQDRKLRYEVNKSFYCIGILNTSEEAKLIQKYVQSNQWPAFIFFRLNLFEKDEILDVVTITNQIPDRDYYLEKTKSVRNQFYMKKAEDDKVRQVAEQQERQQRIANNPLFSQQMDYNSMIYQQVQPQQYQVNLQQQQQQQEQERQIRLEEERRLKAQQEKEYQESIKLQKQKEMEKWEEEKKQQDEEIQQIIQEQLREEEIKKKKENVPKEEPAEDTEGVIKIAFRCPMGERVQRRFMLSDKVQLVYDYVETNMDIEFEHKLREFDLIQAAPYLNLSDKKDKTLDEVFDGSDYELINISEK